MSKNIIIQEGGVGRQLTADRLRTGLVEGGTCLWVPEDEVKLGRKTVSENGTYLAADDGLYGFSRFTVKGVGTAKGKGADGRRYAVSTDAGGNLVYTALAESIRITALPEVTSYGDGAYIRFEGLEVTACDDQGNALEKVPFEELIFPVAVADLAEAAPSAAELGEYKLSILPVGGWMDDKHYYRGVDYNVAEGATDTVYMIAFNNKWGNNEIDYFSRAPFTIRSTRTYTDGTKPVNNYMKAGYRDTIDYYFSSNTGGFSPGSITPPLAAFYTWKEYDKFYALLKQTKAIEDVGGQSIPVRWARDGDGEILETSFNITVIPAGGHGED